MNFGSRINPRSLVIVGSCLVVLSVQLGWINAFGSPLVTADDWRIPQWLLLPLVSAQLDTTQVIDQLFRPHNEHRIFLMRLVALIAFGQNNQQWDILVMLLASALLLSGSVAIVLMSHRGHLPITSSIFIITLLTVPNHLPSTLLWYFGLGWYFFLFFSVVAIYLNASSTALNSRWWLSVACAFIAFFGVASVGALLALFLRECTILVFKPQRLRSVGAAIVIAVIIYCCVKLTYGGGASSFTGNLFRSVFSPGFMADFLRKMGMGLVWPYTDTPHSLVGLLLYAPCALYFCRALLRPFKSNSFEMKLGACLALFFLCHLTAICLGRGYPNEGRYMELPPFGIVGNFFVLSGFLRQASKANYRKPLACIFFVWLAIVSYGLFSLCNTDRLETFHEGQRKSIELIKQFLVDSDREAFATSPHVPFPPHVSSETIDAIVKSKPFKIFSYHYYMPAPYRRLDIGLVYSLWQEGKMGNLSFVAEIVITGWQVLLMLGTAITLYGWCLGLANARSRAIPTGTPRTTHPPTTGLPRVHPRK